MSLLSGLFPPFIAVASGDPRTDWPRAWPEEEQALRHAVPARQREFRAGRGLAREAMQRLQLPTAAIPQADDRAPIWPPGTVGSISHCTDLCVVAVGSTVGTLVSIGLDIEPAEPLDADLIGEVCNSAEQAWLSSLPAARRGISARLVFSAKECAYKAQYPLSRALFDSAAITVDIDPAGRFTAQFNIDAPPFQKGFCLSGSFAMDVNHIVTGMTLLSHQLVDGPTASVKILGLAHA